MEKKIPVILDTDIGSDLDDSWALALLLKCPELDLKLVTTEEGDAVYKAKLCAKMLQAAGREDVPVGLGITTNGDVPNIADWVENYDLSSYPNVIEDGVQAIIDTVMSSEEKVTILAIGPFKTLAAAVEREPRIAEKSKILGVCGNIYNGAAAEYNWYPVLGSEANIAADLDSYRKTAEREGWEVEMVPLDLTGNLYLVPELYSKVEEKRHTDPLIAALMECCEIWYKNMNFNFYGQSSCLFDTAGVYAAFTHENMEYQTLPLKVTDDSLTLINFKEGKEMEVAIRWYDKQKFYDFLVKRLCSDI